MSDPDKEERKSRRKAQKLAERTRKLLLSAQRGVNSVKGRISDPVWQALAQQLASDPATKSELASVLAEALAIHSVEQSKRDKVRRHQAEAAQQQQTAWETQRAAELAVAVQVLLKKKQQLGLDAWCRYLAENPDARALVGVRSRPVKITVAENSILKAKQKEVASRQYIYRTTLIRRGWTAELIDAVLGEPDKLVPNPHYRSGPKAMLYRLDRVEAAEAGRKPNASDGSPANW